MSGGATKWPLRSLAAAALAAVLLAWGPGLATAQSATEMVAGTNDVVTTAPTLGPVTVTLQDNSDNPTGTTFAAISGTQPTVTISVVNPSYVTSANFGTRGVYVGDGENGSPRLSRIDEIGGGTSAMFTSLPVVTAGSGIAVATNRGFMMEAQAASLAIAGVARTGRFQVADITLALNVPMSNVVLHFAGLGGTASGKSFTAEFDLITAQSVGATGLTRLSGNGAFLVSGTQINNGTGSPSASCSATPSAACGSVQVLGTAIRQIVLRVYLRSNDNVAWPTETNQTPRPADAFLIGLSGEVADMVPALTLPTLLWGETTRGLTATCTNAGPNTARSPSCSLVTSGGGTLTTPVCGTAPGGALAPGASVTCTFDYTAPPFGSAASAISATTTTGAVNDRNGGTTTGGNNQLVTNGSVTGTPFAPGTPGAICSAVASRMPFSFTPVSGGTEAGSYDLVSYSPLSYDTSGKPVVMTASGTFSDQTIATAPGTLFKPSDLTTASLATGTGEIVVVSSRVVGRAGSAMTVRVSDDGQEDHDVFTIESASGAMLARTPATGSNATNGDLLLSFTMPAQGFVVLRQYIADYGATYGQRLDGGCLRANIVTVKSRTSAASIEAGQAVTFSITVTNAGPSDASNVQLTDVMPAALTGVTAVPSVGSYSATTGLWTLGALANGASATLTLTGTAALAAAGTTVTNTATMAAGDQTDPTTAADVLSASVSVLQAAQVNATKTVRLLSNSAANCGSRSATADAGVEAFTPGSCVEYLIRLSNPTTALARDIRMTDVLGGSLGFAAASATGFDTSDPLYALTFPASGTVCGGTACTIRLDKARLAANATGEVRIRAVLR